MAVARARRVRLLGSPSAQPVGDVAHDDLGQCIQMGRLVVERGDVGEGLPPAVKNRLRYSWSISSRVSRQSAANPGTAPARFPRPRAPSVSSVSSV